jgi:hypothetical protein
MASSSHSPYKLHSRIFIQPKYRIGSRRFNVRLGVSKSACTHLMWASYFMGWSSSPTKGFFVGEKEDAAPGFVFV